jgi:hypothetical protein
VRTVVPHRRRTLLVTLGVGAAAVAAAPEVRYLQRLTAVSQALREPDPEQQERAGRDAR